MNREHHEQVALFNWWHYEAQKMGLDSRLLVAIPNQGRSGGWKAARRGAYMKAEGLRAGMPDIFFFVARNGYHGMAIELKAPVKTARVSPAQDAMINLLMAQGYVCHVARGWGEAKTAIEEYLKPVTKY